MRYLLLLLPLLTCAPVRPQATTGTADFFLDPVGKRYYLLADDRLVTANPLGQNRFEFYDSSLGGPDLVDVTNPVAILLYYEAYGQIVVLDRTLSEVSRLDLFSLDEILEPAALARATDNNIWVFDGWDYRLKLLDKQGKVARKSNDLRLELKMSEAPDAVYVDRQSVLLHFMEDRRLAVFTNYGRFERWVALPEAEAYGWHAPLLFGSGQTSWLLNVATGARTQVQEKVKGKALAGKEGYYRFGESGAVEWQKFGQN